MNQQIKKRIEEINNGIVPKGFEKTDQGIINKDFVNNKTFIGDLGKFCGGGTPQTNVLNYWNGNIPWISSSDIIEDNINYINGKHFITEEAIKQSATKICPPNTIHIVSRVGVGKVAISKCERCTSQDFINLYNCDGNIEYLAYMIKNRINNGLRKLQGTSIKGISSDEIKKNELYITKDIKEQEKIAEILMKWDTAIDLQEKYIQKLEERKKNILKKIFSNNDNCTPICMSEIGDLYQPTTISESELTNDGYLVYGANGILGKYTKYNHEKSEIAITCRGSTSGMVVFTEPKSWITGNAMVFKINENKFNKKYIYYLCSYRGFKDVVSGSGIPQITRSSLQKIKLKVLSDIKEQKEITDIIDKVNEEINLQKEKLEKLKQQRKALQQYLLTGVVKVEL